MLVGLGPMKNIDIKSLLIGALFTSTIFLGVAATGPDDKWDKDQVWHVQKNVGSGEGWEPFADGLYRKRVK